MIFHMDFYNSQCGLSEFLGTLVICTVETTTIDHSIEDMVVSCVVAKCFL